MASPRGFFFAVIVQVLLLLDSPSAQLTSFYRVEEIPGGAVQTSRKTYYRWYTYSDNNSFNKNVDNSFGRNVYNSFERNTDNRFPESDSNRILRNTNNPFLQDSDNLFFRQTRKPVYNPPSPNLNKYSNNPFFRATQKPPKNDQSTSGQNPVENNPQGVANVSLKITNPFNRKPTVVEVDDVKDRPATFATPNFRDRVVNTQLSRSEQKCKEYHNILSGQNPAPTFRNSENDGKKEEDWVVHHLVVGGRDVERNKLPHVVALGRLSRDNKFSLHCGGSLIARRWVLTAAHCTHGYAGGVTVARLGIQRLSDTDGQTLAIKRTIRHPSYKPPAMYADIALLELEREVSFSESIKPACLHQPQYSIPDNAWVCGWGATEFGGSEADTLQEALLDFVNNIECTAKHSSSIAVPDGVMPSMVCAGAPRSGWQQDTCTGDSGGPLQVQHRTYRELHQIIGITSFGSGCAFVDSPGVYTRVSHYLDWIENIVWPAGS